MNTPLRLFCVAAAATSCFCARGAGVTVVTHGFLGNITDWVIPMLNRVPAYPGFPGTNFTCYSITLRENAQGNIVASRALLSGSVPLATDSGEILIKLDWSDLAGFFGSSSTEVAAAAVSALTTTNLFPEFGGHTLVELPLHLAGHSRGGSVVSEMARLLGAQGIWVDHMTLLDPHPVVEFGDAAVRVWQNVLFADNYWQVNSDATCPNGESELGAYNRFLANLSGGYGCSHSDVHLWYHGTIDATTPTGDNDATITSAERQNWWTQAEAAGAQAGFRYSRIGGGNRFSIAEPAGPGTGRIRDGYNQVWDFGAGTSANRYALPSNNGSWPNIMQFDLTGTNTIAVGEFTATRFFYQSGPTTNQLVTIDFFLDADRNPYNSNSFPAGSIGIPNTGTNAVYAVDGSVFASRNVAAGVYAVCARSTFGANTRYIYAPQLLRVVPTPPPRFARIRRINGGQMELLVEARLGQRVVLEASSGFTNWSPIATNTVTSSPFVVVDTAPGQRQRFYRAIAE